MSDKRAKQSFSFDEVFAEEGKNCNRDDEVFEYFEGVLTKTDANEFEKHLGVCNHCAAGLIQLQEIQEAAEVDLDPGKAKKLFDLNRTKLRDHLDLKYGGRPELPVKGSGAFFRFFNLFSLPNYANALVMALVLILAYPAYRSFVLKNEVDKLQGELALEKSRNVAQPTNLQSLKESYEKQIQSLTEERQLLLEPSISPTLIYSARPERTTGAESIPITFSGKQKSFNIIFSIPVADYKGYSMEISRGGTTIWQQEGLLNTPSGSPLSLVSVNLHSEYLKEGSYRLRVFGMGDKEKSLLVEYGLQVSQRDLSNH
jgi:hypothetical protein